MIILRDKREKVGYWTFAGKNCQPTHLVTGDYTLRGYEDVICLERKRSISEAHSNLCSKRDKPRFYRELERMMHFEHAYILLEFSEAELARYPFDLPPKVRRKIRVRGPYLAKLISRIESEYGIPVFFCGDRQGAIDKAWEIFTEVVEESNES